MPPKKVPATIEHAQTLKAYWDRQAKSLLWADLEAPMWAGALNLTSFLPSTARSRYGCYSNEPRIAKVSFQGEDEAKKFAKSIREWIPVSVGDEPDTKDPLWIAGKSYPGSGNALTAFQLLHFEHLYAEVDAATEDRESSVTEDTVRSLTDALPDQKFSVIAVKDTDYCLVGCQNADTAELWDIVNAFKGQFSIHAAGFWDLHDKCPLNIHLKPVNMDPHFVAGTSHNLFGHHHGLHVSVNNDKVVIQVDQMDAFSCIYHFWTSGVAGCQGNLQVYVSYAATDVGEYDAAVWTDPNIIDKGANAEKSLPSLVENVDDPLPSVFTNAQAQPVPTRTKQVDALPGPSGKTYTELRLDSYPVPAEDCMEQLFEEGSRRIHSWFSTHHLHFDRDAKTYLQMIPGCANILDALLSLDNLLGDPYKLIQACNTGMNIEPDDEVVYALVIMTTAGALLQAVEVIKSKRTSRRIEIEKAIKECLAGRKSSDKATAIYGGYTVRIAGRSAMDLIHVSDPENTTKNDTRTPLHIVEQVAGKATSLDQFGYVTYNNRVARLHRADGVPAKTMPTVLRVPVVALKDIPGSFRGDIEGVIIALLGIRKLNVQSGVLSPPSVNSGLLTAMRSLIQPNAHREILVISEGAQSLESTRTGYDFVQGIRDLQSDSDVVLCEHLLPPSKHITDNDVERVLIAIKRRYKLVMVVGATEAWKKVVRRVVDKSVPLGSEFGAFEVSKVGDEDVIFVKVAHPAVINYIGEHADWVWDMIHKAQAVALVLVTLISQSPLIAPADVLRLAASMPTVKQEIDELMSASSHSYYAGGVASKLHWYRQDGYTWEEAAIMIRAEGGLQTITSILP